MTDPNSSLREDAKDLEQFGYFQQLQRSMGAFSSFAISFSLISITTGIFGNFGHGLKAFGPAVILAWIVAAVGQFLVALVVAELAARLPISGYGYQWASRIINPHVGFFVGWCLLLQFLIGFPAICATISDYLCAYQDLPASYAPFITMTVVTIIALVHLVGIKVVSWVNDAGVIAEILGCAAIALMLLGLWVYAPSAPISILTNSTNADTGLPGSFFAFASSLLLGAWCITGFEGAADLAEETHAPRATIPKAIINSELSSGIGGLIMLVAFMLSISDLAAVQASETPLMDIMQSKFSPNVMKGVMLVVYISIFACGVASMAAATRLLFAMARDNMLPASNILCRIDPKTHSPRESILLVWLVSCLVVPLLQQVKVLSSVATVAAYLGYAGIVVTLLVHASRAKLPTEPGLFQLGRWRSPIAIIALIWLVTAILALTLTDAPNYLTAITTFTSLMVGVVIYFVFVHNAIIQNRAGPPTGPAQSTGDAP